MSTRIVAEEGHRGFESVAEFLRVGNVATGTYSVMAGGLPIDLKYEDRGYDVTIVFFHAAISKAVKRYPVFSGSTFSEHVSANRLFVSDPSLYVDKRLKLAWYAGSSVQPELQDTLSQVLAKFMPPGQKIVLFGASGGGFAALYFATRFPRSIAVPVNPQTTLAAYNPVIVARYLKYAWHGSALDDISPCVDLVRLYSDKLANSVMYVQNTGDEDHMSRHRRPFIDALPNGQQVESILVDAGEGHVSPPRNRLGEILVEAVERSKSP